MLKLLKQVRSSVSLLNPDTVRRMVARAPELGLVASSPSGYAALEDFLIPAEVPHHRRLALMRHLHRAGDPGSPDKFDLVLYEPGVPCPAGCFPLALEDPNAALRVIVAERDDLALALASHFPPFRRPVVDSTIMAVCRENALFAVASALPNIIPNLIELPWAVGEFASDTAFLTINQIRMAFVVAAATGKPVGFAEQKFEIGSIVGAAFGWRAIARELAGKIPLGGGLIAKGSIAFAGTYVIGKGLERWNHVGRTLSQDERRTLYNEGLAKGRRLVEEAGDGPEGA
jgi:hypothetical protein